MFEDLEIDKIRSEQNEGWGIWCGGNSFMVNVMEFGDTSYVAQNKKGGIYFAGSEAYLSRVSIKENGITSGGGHGGPGSKSRSLRCGLLDEPRTRFGRWFDL